MFKRFVIGFAVGMALTNYVISSSIPLLDRLEGWLRTATHNYTGQKTHKAADEVFNHER